MGVLNEKRCKTNKFLNTNGMSVSLPFFMDNNKAKLYYYSFVIDLRKISLPTHLILDRPLLLDSRIESA